MDLTEAEDIKKRWQEYTEELYKRDLNHPDNHDGVITHLDPNILKCEVKWAIGCLTTNKASGGDKIAAGLLQIPGCLTLGKTIVVIWIMMIFLYSSSVYSCHLLLISSASVRSIQFLSFIVPSLHKMFPWYL